MKIQILISAVKDLEEGRIFYEKQGAGVGDYFFDTLFSDIDSLALFGGIHRKFLWISIDYFPADFLMQYIIKFKGG